MPISTTLAIVLSLLVFFGGYPVCWSQPATGTRGYPSNVDSTAALFARDDYALYFSSGELSYYAEIYNPTDSNIILQSVKSNSGSRLPFVWHHWEGSIAVRPGRSVLVGLVEGRLQGYELGEYLQKNPRFDLTLFCNFLSLPQFGGSSGVNSLMLRRIVKEPEVRECSPRRMPLVPQSSDSLQIDSDLFDFVVRRRSPERKHDDTKIVFGLIKFHNHSNQELIVENLYTNDSYTRFIGVPEWNNSATRARCNSIAIPPHTSMAVEYGCDAIVQKFNGDTEKFLNMGYEFQAFVKIRGSEKVRSVSVKLNRDRIRLVTDADHHSEMNWMMDIGD